VRNAVRVALENGSGDDFYNTTRKHNVRWQLGGASGGSHNRRGERGRSRWA
jgi:hypothetical protein